MSQTKTIKFFISSTFKDFVKERNVLQQFVFPELKNICQKKGFAFQPVDLRWGVTQEVSENNQTLQYCLNEVSRCSHEPKPNLLILLGQRYGWGPLPQNITVKEREYLQEKIDAKDFKLVAKWYIQDENDVEKKYFLKEKKALSQDEWSIEENKLKNLFQNTTKGKNEKPLKGYEHFHTSATEQEIRYAIDKQFKANSNNTFIFTREFSAGEDESLIEKSQKAQDKLTNLKDYLQELEVTHLKKKDITTTEYKSYADEYERLEDLPKYLKNFYDTIFKEFKEKIETEMKFFEKQSDLEIEKEQQKRFLNEKSKIVLGRDNEIKDIKQFILDSDEQYYLLYGESGSGKSSVMAKTISELLDKDGNSLVPDHKFIYKFIGTTAHTSSPRDTYEYIYWQLKGTQEKPKDIEHEDYKFYAQFKEALQEYTQDEKLTIFIDAVDQFSVYDSLSIFLDELPQNVKIVFSTLYNDERKNEEYANYFERLSGVVQTPKKLEIQNSNNEEILKAWLDERQRKLTKSQFKLIIDSAKNKTPLYLRLAFIISLEWKSTEKIIKEALGETPQELIIKYFDNVIEKHSVKRELLELVLGLIGASKDGLSESELIDLLSREEDILALYERENSSYPKLTRFPAFLFSKLYYHIQEVFTEKLIDNEMLINPFHRIIEEVIRKECHNKNYNMKLADYFKSKNIYKKDDFNIYYLRSFNELPYQYIQFDTNQILNLLKDFEFMVDIFFYEKNLSFFSLIYELYLPIIKDRDSYTNRIVENLYLFYKEYEEKICLLLNSYSNDKYKKKILEYVLSNALLDGWDSPLHELANIYIYNTKKNLDVPKPYNIACDTPYTGLLTKNKKHNFDGVLEIYNLNDSTILSSGDDGKINQWSLKGTFIQEFLSNVCSSIKHNDKLYFSTWNGLILEYNFNLKLLNAIKSNNIIKFSKIYMFNDLHYIMDHLHEKLFIVDFYKARIVDTISALDICIYKDLIAIIEDEAHIKIKKISDQNIIFSHAIQEKNKLFRVNNLNNKFIFSTDTNIIYIQTEIDLQISSLNSSQLESINPIRNIFQCKFADSDFSQVITDIDQVTDYSIFDGSNITFFDQSFIATDIRDIIIYDEAGNQ